MSNCKNKAPYTILDDKQYKLYDFCENFSEIQHFEAEKHNDKLIVDKNISKTIKNGFIVFKYIKVRCPYCNSNHVVKIGFYDRKLIFLNEGEKICKVQEYKCKKCDKKFNTDLNRFVYKNNNITLAVINKILDIYSIYGASLHKIRYGLKKEHNVNISHQSIENIIKSYEIEETTSFWSYSGFYLFDALWVKINGKWNYLLALFDLKLNTLVSYKIVSNESETNIKKFLEESTRNQPRISN